jgi:hypothetical protein
MEIEMRFRCLRFFAPLAAAACLLPGCASAPSAGAEERHAEVRVYEPADLSSSEYDVVRHLWVDNWSTALWMPTYSSEAEGITALQNEAASVGADGLINVFCVDRGRQIWSTNSGPALVCYASAIRVRRGPG